MTFPIRDANDIPIPRHGQSQLDMQFWLKQAEAESTASG